MPDPALRPSEDQGPTSNQRISAASRPSGESDDHEQHSIAEVKNLLRFQLVLLVGAEPVFNEAANRLHALEGGAQTHCLIHGIGRARAERHVKVVAAECFKGAACK